ncbi:MAG: HDIG domain-containing protein [Lachnospiraceae bacterium]|nr:HDIG domain-containing protein [Lachnospiraceae bacterium]
MNREMAKQILAEAKALNDGGWIQHSYNVAHLAEKIAGLCNMDVDKAYCFGLLHDIGRRNGTMQSRHIIDGYKYMLSIGCNEEARICLTHTFQYKDIHGIYDNWDCEKEDIEFVENYLKSVEYNDFDRLIQLCDALSLSSGYCYMEKKMVSAVRKFGFKNTTIQKWNAIFDLKEFFDQKAGVDIYTLFDM